MKLKKFTASTPPPRETGLVRADPRALTDVGDAQFNAAEFKAMAQAGATIQNTADIGFQAYMKRRKLDEDIRWGNATSKTEEFTNQSVITAYDTNFFVDDPLPGSPDYLKSPLQLSLDKREQLINEGLAEYDKAVGEITQSFSTEEERAKYQLYGGKRRVGFKEEISKAYRDKHNDYQKDRMQRLALDAYRSGDIETGDSYIDSMDENEIITPEKATQLRLAGREESVMSAISFYKTAAMAPGVDEKQREILFDAARTILQSGKIKDPEKKLPELQSINLLEQQLIRKDEREKFDHDVRVREEFTEKLSTEKLSEEDEKGVFLKLDDVRREYPTDSSTDVAEVQFWAEVIEGSNKPNPYMSTGKGMGMVNEILSKVAAGTKDTKSAYNDLVTARYIDRTINDKTFNWVKKRIQSPYSEQLSNMINNVMSRKHDKIKDAENWIFYTQAEKKRVGDKMEQINMELFQWIDAELEKDPNKIFTPQEINNMEAQVGATVYKSDADFDTAPKTQAEFERNVGDLKALDMDRAKEYYNKWAGKWQ